MLGLDLVPAILSSFYLTLSKMNSSLKQTATVNARHSEVIFFTSL